MELGTDEQWFVRAANQIAQLQKNKIVSAYQKVVQRYNVGHAVIIGAGCGQFLAREIAKQVHQPYQNFMALLQLTEPTFCSNTESAVALAYLLQKHCMMQAKQCATQ